MQQQQHHDVSHHQARWLNLLAEYQYHITDRTNPADFLTRKRFPDGSGPAPHTGYAEPDLAPELFTPSGATSAFVAAGPSAESPRFLHVDFAARFARRSPLIRFWGLL